MRTLHLLTRKDGPPLYRRLRWLRSHYRERFGHDVAIHTCRKGADGLWACSWPDCAWAWPALVVAILAQRERQDIAHFAQKERTA